MPPKFHDRAAVYPAVYAALRQQAGGSSPAQPASYEQPMMAEPQEAAPAVDITAREVRCCCADCPCSRELPAMSLYTLTHGCAPAQEAVCLRTLNYGGPCITTSIASLRQRLADKA